MEIRVVAPEERRPGRRVSQNGAAELGTGGIMQALQDVLRTLAGLMKTLGNN